MARAVNVDVVVNLNDSQSPATVTTQTRSQCAEPASAHVGPVSAAGLARANSEPASAAVPITVVPRKKARREKLCCIVLLLCGISEGKIVIGSMKMLSRHR